MKRRCLVGCAVVAAALVGAGTGAVAGDAEPVGFVPGHVFVSDPSLKLCMNGDVYGWDRIWEIDPESGQVTLFVELRDDWCGFVTGLAFTPDGTRLRASSMINSRILEFDSQGNVEVVLDASDGIAAPWGSNNLAYDTEGNFFVVNHGNRRIMKFPLDGGPGTVFADDNDGISGLGAIAFAADGDLYFGNRQAQRNLLRITPDGEASLFDSYENNNPVGLTADDAAHVYVGLAESHEILRYDAGDPESREVLGSGAPFALVYAMSMAPDQGSLYVAALNLLVAVDLTDGSVTTLAELTEAGFATNGIAVVPSGPAEIPTVSTWALVVMTLLVVTIGAIVLRTKAGRVSGRIGTSHRLPEDGRIHLQPVAVPAWGASRLGWRD